MTMLSARAYLVAYPGFCRQCNGWGLLSSFKGCKCVQRGLCPRCGENEPALLDPPYLCRNCGWDPGDDHRGLPGSTQPGGAQSEPDADAPAWRGE